jgi:two-component system, sensor histidine kinase and response regulator
MATTAGGSSGRILVVDDQPANLRVVAALLSRHGYEVQAADKGEDALALVAERTPDLLLLDMMMPGMDGFALLEKLKEIPKLRRAPVVFLTAAQDRDLLLRAFEAGAVDYVTKPFMPEELLARVDAHVGLKLTRDRLERVARERQELVNLVAHDLKNPLSSVLFASDMLLQGACKPERIPRYLQVIQDSTRDALGYIRRYLETQERRAAHGNGHESGTRASLCGVVQWLHARYELQAEGRGMQLNTSLPDRDVLVGMDEQVLRQVAENLMTNAIKYAADGGSIDVQVRAGGEGFWQLQVADRGPGIPARLQRELFKPFTRLTEEDPAAGMSSGLGLSLAHQIVLDAGGNLSYQDREGGGACFSIELPEVAPT